MQWLSWIYKCTNSVKSLPSLSSHTYPISIIFENLCGLNREYYKCQKLVGICRVLSRSKKLILIAKRHVISHGKVVMIHPYRKFTFQLNWHTWCKGDNSYSPTQPFLPSTFDFHLYILLTLYKALSTAGCRSCKLSSHDILLSLHFKIILPE